MRVSIITEKERRTLTKYIHTVERYIQESLFETEEVPELHAELLADQQLLKDVFKRLEAII